MTMFDPGGKKSGSRSPSPDPVNQQPGVGKVSLVERARQDLAGAGLAPMSVATEAGKFAKRSAAADEVVKAQKVMTADAADALLTIAMFEYMATHAGALATVIQHAMRDLPDILEQEEYLQSLSNEMVHYIQKTVWIGPEREQIQNGSFNLQGFFQSGSVALLQKASEAKAANKPMVGLLNDIGTNLDAKSYGRRAESVAAIAVAGLPSAAAEIVKSGGSIALNDPLYSYFDEDTYLPIDSSALAVGNSYGAHFNHSKTVTVHVSAKTATHVTFDSVE
jgi:hypothetical protein